MGKKKASSILEHRPTCQFPGCENGAHNQSGGAQIEYRKWCWTHHIMGVAGRLLAINQWFNDNPNDLFEYGNINMSVFVSDDDEPVPSDTPPNARIFKRAGIKIIKPDSLTHKPSSTSTDEFF